MNKYIYLYLYKHLMSTILLSEPTIRKDIHNPDWIDWVEFDWNLHLPTRRYPRDGISHINPRFYTMSVMTNLG